MHRVVDGFKLLSALFVYPLRVLLRCADFWSAEEEQCVCLPPVHAHTYQAPYVRYLDFATINRNKIGPEYAYILCDISLLFISSFTHIYSKEIDCERPKSFGI
jgi:hypothetical protein